MTSLNRKTVKKKTIMYKGKLYIKVATATGNKFSRIIAVICLLLSCMLVSAKSVRVFTGNIQRVEKTVMIGSNAYSITLKDGTVYQLEDERQYNLVIENWRYFKFITLNVKDNGEE